MYQSGGGNDICASTMALMSCIIECRSRLLLVPPIIALAIMGGTWTSDGASPTTTGPALSTTLLRSR